MYVHTYMPIKLIQILIDGKLIHTKGDEERREEQSQIMRVIGGSLQLTPPLWDQ